MINLPDITLVCVETRWPQLAAFAIHFCVSRINFGSRYFFTGELAPPIKDLEDYSKFVIKDLAQHIKTSHVLIIQWDGFVIRPEAWSDEFLKYDYVGAPWGAEHNNMVGNGGFSLRSKKLLDACAAFEPPFFPEDMTICVKNRKPLEDLGIKFAPHAVASSFSAELTEYTGQFGFHSFLTPNLPIQWSL